MQIRIVIILVIISSLFLYDCRKDEVLSGDLQLEFSTDTLTFDTVFTTVGSITKRFTIFNPNDDRIEIDEIRLDGGSASDFRINVDGIPGNVISNLEIRAKDSAFVFVQVTVDPNNSNNPLIISDAISFITGNTIRQVHLNAWGQDAYFHNRETICNATWTNDKPHVIYGFAAVDSACTLTINPGTQIYGHPGARLIIYKGALIADGTSDKIVFQNDRLDAPFSDLPGGWRGIYFFAPLQSTLTNVEVKNANVGIQIDTFQIGQTVTLSKVNSYNHSNASLFAQTAQVTAENCVFGSAGRFSAGFNIGGNYNFNHCTFANYWSNGSRNDPLLLLNDYFVDINGNTHFRPFTQLAIRNSIIYGTNREEITIDTLGVINYPSAIINCLSRTELNTNTSLFSSPIATNQDPRFVSNDDFHLQSNSPAIDQGITPAPSTFDDLDGNFRDANADLGAYEFN